MGVPGPTEEMTPAQSPPGCPGLPGYMPRMFSTSRKLRPTARTEICRHRLLSFKSDATGEGHTGCASNRLTWS